MSDEELRTEVQHFAGSGWQRESRLIRHAAKHGEETAWALGLPQRLSVPEYESLRLNITAFPDRIYTGLSREGGTEYHFVRMVYPDAIIVVVRDGFVRTLLLAEPFIAWFGRHEVVEVTSRVKLPLF